MNSLVRVEFEGHPIGLFSWKGRRAALAREVGIALGYEEDGHRLAKNVTGDWSDELIDGVDYEVVKGAELPELKRALRQPGAETALGRAAHAIVLFETGIRLAGLLSRKPHAKRFRRWLAEEVLPQIETTGAYVHPVATRDDVDARIEAMQRQIDALNATSEAAMKDTRPRIGAGAAREYILDPIRQIARLKARADGDPATFSKYRGEAEASLRDALHFPAVSGHAFANLPRVQLGRAANIVERMADEARRAAQRRGQQMKLPPPEAR